MKLITRQTRADEAPGKWVRQYGEGVKAGEKWGAKSAILTTLPKPIDPDEVDRIIGNTSWTAVGECDECDQAAAALVQIGHRLDYDSSTATVCESCLRKALALLEVPA